MRFRAALERAGAAARANLLPGLLLQAVLVVFLALYLWHHDTQEVLGRVARLKQETGYAFAFVSYVVAAVLLPEFLRITFFQGCRITRKNAWNFLTAAPFWGCMGMVVDLLYRLQGVWFGSGHALHTIVCKVLVDQFLFSPLLSVPWIVGYFYWRDEGFRVSVLREIFSVGFFLEKVFPVLVAGWCIWIPGVSLVYFMPPLLQMPVAVLIQVFYVLILTTMSERKTGSPPPPAG
jgi:hypothetical protein